MDTATFSEHHTYYCELPHLSLITIAGPDAAKFLQGQVTSDVRELTQPVTHYGAQCSLKGRVMVNFRALQMSPELIALCVSSDLVNDTLASLQKYIVFSKAKLHDNRSQFTLIGIYGHESAKVVTAYFGRIPNQNNAWIEHQGNYLVQLDEQRYECWINTHSQAEFTALISQHALAGQVEHWHLLDIRAGIAWITAPTRELFTPQALNYQLINAISFRKGCYTGQEIVARMHYRGKLKRHTYRYELSGDNLPFPGSAVYDDTRKSVLGEVVTAAFSRPNTIELLASINGEDCGPLYLADNPEKLKRLELPYAIPCGEETPPNT